MPLAPGARLGPYEILAPIGEGGMGELYRARDTKLKRARIVLPTLRAAGHITNGILKGCNEPGRYSPRPAAFHVFLGPPDSPPWRVEA
jgi:serine/threonine protein kinase